MIKERPVRAEIRRARPRHQKTRANGLRGQTREKLLEDTLERTPSPTRKHRYCRRRALTKKGWAESDEETKVRDNRKEARRGVLPRSSPRLESPLRACG